jgi:hypothetical protein
MCFVMSTKCSYFNTLPMYSTFQTLNLTLNLKMGQLNEFFLLGGQGMKGNANLMYMFFLLNTKFLLPILFSFFREIIHSYSQFFFL